MFYIFCFVSFTTVDFSARCVRYAMIFVRRSVCLSVWDGRALQSYDAS